MNQAEKKVCHEQAKQRVSHVRSQIQEAVAQTETRIMNVRHDITVLGRADQMVQAVLIAYNQKRMEELHLLYPSPYFVRCDFTLDEGQKKTLYFAKFPFIEESIYSWVAPAAAIRFEKPGRISYQKTDGKVRHGTLTRKDQYMILDGHIVFLSSESIGTEQELIYQEHFSTRKTGFVLPEIVEQMEKAQDQVIRAHYQGPFVISGPAGSGKTTLALHRVAYLVQAPDTQEQFKSNSIIVFVQDAGTKNYFSHLLPELGITDVTITTFADWAKSILNLEQVEYVWRYGESESERDQYEWEKLQALHAKNIPKYSQSPFVLLEKVYESHLSPEMKRLFQKQKTEQVLDRFDLTILLQVYQETHGQLDMEQSYFVQQRKGDVIRKRKRFPIEYSLIVADEFQNYLPEQLALMRGCANKINKSIVYVGDMAQQIHLGTIRDWQEIQEKVEMSRKVMLQKVYRNTKEILHYIKSLGYNIPVPKEIKNGAPVVEYTCASKEDELLYVRKLASRTEVGSIGILAKDQAYLSTFKKAFVENKNIYVLSMTEAQGVEFDVVCLVGLREDTFSVANDISPEFTEQKKRIQKDLLYVALTRAMGELHILGTAPLSEMIGDWGVL